MRTNGTMRVVAAVAAGVLLFAGCSSSDDSGSEDTTTTKDAGATTTSAGDGASTTVADATELTGKGALDLADNPDLGEILVQGGGFTVYLTTADTGTEPTCVDNCAQAWPPLTGDVEVGEGVDESLVGTTTRPDGTEQITYNGHPLYLFASDAEPGETAGQGVGGVWYVVDAGGNPVDDD